MEKLRNIQSKEQAIAHFIESCPFVHPDLDIVVVPGSHNNTTFGNRSDLDITTVLKPENPTVVDIKPMVEMSEQIREWADAVCKHTCVSPVVVATIKLEEAQIQMGRMQTKGKYILPIHWLFHPSVEFMSANEPPALASGILQGHILVGNTIEALARLENSDQQVAQKVKGLDWLTDGLRILLANCSIDGQSLRQPADFLIQNASHNLHWFWKWNIVVPMARQITGNPKIGWPESIEIIKRSNFGITQTFSQVHKVRHEGEKAKVQDIVKLHAITFSLWPTLQK